MGTLRPADLAREHGISTQTVRNHEHSGFLPTARRTPAGYRVYTELHAEALRTYLRLVPAFGYGPAGRIMRAVNDDDLDEALAVVDDGHGQLRRDRETLATVREAVLQLATEPDAAVSQGTRGARTIGELAHRLRLTPATLRNWERAGILRPDRDPGTGHRLFRAEDRRDAELAHLLRRGGYLLDEISAVVRQVRTVGGTEELSAALGEWQRKLTGQGLAMLTASARLDGYIRAREVRGRVHRPHARM